MWLRLLLVGLALPAGALQWRLVEEPLRHGCPLALAPATLALRLATATVACGLFGIAVIGPLERSYPLHPPPDAVLAAVCDQRRRHSATDDACPPPSRISVPGTGPALHLAALPTVETRFLPGLVPIERTRCTPIGSPAAASLGTPHACAAGTEDAHARVAAATGLAKLQASRSRLPDARLAEDRRADAVRTATAVAHLVERLRNAGERALQLAPARASAADLPGCLAPPTEGGPLARREGGCHAMPSRPLPRRGPAEATRTHLLRPT